MLYISEKLQKSSKKLSSAAPAKKKVEIKSSKLQLYKKKLELKSSGFGSQIFVGA